MNDEISRVKFKRSYTNVKELGNKLKLKKLFLMGTAAATSKDNVRKSKPREFMMDNFVNEMFRKNEGKLDSTNEMFKENETKLHRNEVDVKIIENEDSEDSEFNPFDNNNSELKEEEDESDKSESHCSVVIDCSLTKVNNCKRFSLKF